MKYKSTKNSYFLDTRSQFFFIFLVKISFCMIIIEIMKKNVTSEIYTLGTQFYYRMKLFWSSCFAEKISMIPAPVQKLRVFFRRKSELFGRFRPFLVQGFIQRIYKSENISLTNIVFVFISPESYSASNSDIKSFIIQLYYSLKITEMSSKPNQVLEVCHNYLYN